MNNSFLNCIAQICGLEVAALSKGGKYTVFSDSVAVLEGCGKLQNYSQQQVTFTKGKRQLCICGNNLRLKSMTADFAVVEGKISSVTVTDD